MCLSNSQINYEPFSDNTDVSILVLMDVPLELEIPYFKIVRGLNVSILVLMDVPLEFYCMTFIVNGLKGFNPCFNGCASRITRQTGNHGYR